MNAFKKFRKENDVAHKYISFIHTYYFEEELNQYPKKEFDKLARKNKITIKGKSKTGLLNEEAI